MKWKSSKLSLATQKMALEALFPDATARIYKNKLSWRGTILPSELSRAYQIQLFYKLGSSPKVFLHAPKLQMREGERPPHIYPNCSLCLYHPSNKEWHDKALIVDTIIPWCSEWLVNYEIWLATGEWLGGGIHPPS